eukprot:6197291-Pleurochrysis_carterae.AAC.3
MGLLSCEHAHAHAAETLFRANPKPRGNASHITCHLTLQPPHQHQPFRSPILEGVRLDVVRHGRTSIRSVEQVRKV